MIVVENLHKSFVRQGKPASRWGLGLGKRQKQMVKAVDGVSFTAKDGTIMGLLGANGAGKTTSLRMVAALLTVDQGSIMIDGSPVLAGQLSTQAKVGILSDARGLYPRMTTRENITYYGQLHGMQKADIARRIDQLAHWLGLKDIMERRTDGFSQGERMKVALARALIHDPQNIILDEPTNGLDVVATRALREFLRWLRSPEGGNKCIIFSTHIMQEVERLCDDVVVISQGRTVAHGSVTELLQQAGETDFEDAFVKLGFLKQEAFSATAVHVSTSHPGQPNQGSV